jgi:hypothetical protein
MSSQGTNGAAEDVNAIERVDLRAVAALHEELKGLMPHLVGALKRNQAHDDLSQRLIRAERQVAAVPSWPMAAAVHAILTEVRSYGALDPSSRAAIEQSLLRLLDQFGFDEFGAVGEPFDPDRHDAVAGDMVAGQGSVAEVHQHGLGFMQHIVVRAQVTVGIPTETQPPIAHAVNANLEHTGTRND